MRYLLIILALCGCGVEGAGFDGGASDAEADALCPAGTHEIPCEETLDCEWRCTVDDTAAVYLTDAGVVIVP